MKRIRKKELGIWLIGIVVIVAFILFENIWGIEKTIDTIWAKISSWYYSSKKYLLIIFPIVFCIGSAICFFKISYSKIYLFNYVLKRIINVFLLCIGAFAFYFLGFYPKLKYEHFNEIFFYTILLSIFIFSSIRVCLFWNQKTIIIQSCCEYVCYLIYFLLFWLSLVGRLELLEFITCITAVIFFSLLILGLKQAERKAIMDDYQSESDYPNNDLYPTRRRQLNSFIKILKEHQCEPYGVMVDGEWGLGKTSFIKALEKKLSEDVFIWIWAGSEKTAADVMGELANQIIRLLEEEGIYIEENDVIEKYFYAFSGVSDKIDIKGIRSIIDGVIMPERRNAKDYLNCKLGRLKKTIYLIIDDLDRCNQEYQEQMFKVIRESTDLKNCKTIFLVDRNMLTDRTMSLQYIEKYISYTLDLCKVNAREILEYSIEDVFPNTYFGKLNTILAKNRSPKMLREKICQFPESMIGKCEDMLRELQKKSSQTDPDKEKEKKDIQTIRNIRSIIEKNISNPRKLKRFMKGIKSDLSYLNEGIELCQGRYREEDWFGAVVSVNFVKYILPEMYWEIKASGSLADWDTKGSDYHLVDILDISDFIFSSEINRRYLIERIIFDIGLIDYTGIKTEKERWMQELHSEKGNLEHISKYLEYSSEYDDLREILNLYRKKGTKNVNLRMDMFDGILEIMSKEFSILGEKDERFYEFSKEVIEQLRKENLTDKEKNSYGNMAQRIVSIAIAGNAYAFKNIILPLYNNKAENRWGPLAVTNLKELYTVLKEIDAEKFFKWEKESELENIKEYYEVIKLPLSKKMDLDRQTPLNSAFQTVEMTLKICELWGKENLFENIGLEEEKFTNFFVLEGRFTYQETVFANPSFLIQALMELELFYNQKKSEYKSNYSILLYRVLYKACEINSENHEWFGEHYPEICHLFTNLANQVFSLDKGEFNQEKDVLQKINVYIYKLKSAYKEKQSG